MQGEKNHSKQLLHPENVLVMLFCSFSFSVELFLDNGDSKINSISELTEAATRKLDNGTMNSEMRTWKKLLVLHSGQWRFERRENKTTAMTCPGHTSDPGSM
jgi:hypothetical protein